MRIMAHAIRRYKRRIGKRTASRKRVITQINRDLQRDVRLRKASKIKDHYILVTSKYQAVCYRNRVITIMDLNVDATSYQYDAQKHEELSFVA
ncbi:hypothetical protein ACFX4N_24300 [Priestia sp. YIM B13551]|uniref:hypothetical protein n=1 Tax=Priestia sp. YIM B13551 TaxID=3366306 RepID=UPI0036728BF3